jgi:glycosyltransferase involved in cell wall biosynthesis
VPEEKIHVVPNWMDDLEVVGGVDAAGIRRHHHIPEDAFLLVYGGNVGYAAGVEEVILALGRLNGNRPVYLLVAGSGSQLEACRSLAHQIKAERVRFHTPWPEEETQAVYAAADALVLPTRDRQAQASVPSKLIAYMLAERPILAVSQAETELTDTLLRAKAGWVIEPGDQDALARQMVELSIIDLQRRLEMGKNARAYALKHMTALSCLPAIIQVIENSANSP